MKTNLHLEILPQPNDTTCGPTCLHAVYNYYGDSISLAQVIAEVPTLEDGGTLIALLGDHALARGYAVTIYTFDLLVFDPTWFTFRRPPLAERLQRQLHTPKSPKIRVASRAFLDFVHRGGRIQFQDLTSSLIRRLLKRSLPVITGLSATYLYGTARELQVGEHLVYDDVNGSPAGHFVVLCGYDVSRRIAFLADPLMPNPLSPEHIYSVKLNRLLTAIMLGSITFDANLLVIAPAPKPKKEHRGSTGRYRKS